MKRLVERTLARLWGGRWNAIARGEFLRSFSGGTILNIAVLALMLNGLVVSLWIWAGEEWAGGVARGLTILSWFLAVGITGRPLAQMFIIDEKLGTTDGWLLTPAPREEMLWARLAGQSAAGPLFILALFPTYLIAAATLGSAFHGLFVCGHLARLAGSFGSPRFTIPSAAVAAPLALMAMLVDIVVTVPTGASSVARGVQRAGARGLFTSNPRQWVRWSWRTFVSLMASGAWSLLLEGGAVAVATAAALWMTWEPGLSAWTRAAAGLALSAVLTVALIWGRVAIARMYLRFAGGHYDEALIRDAPE